MHDLHDLHDSSAGVHRRQPAAFDGGLQFAEPSQSMAATLSEQRIEISIPLGDTGDDFLQLAAPPGTVHESWFDPFIGRLVDLLGATVASESLSRLATSISDALYFLESAAPRNLPAPGLSFSPDGGLQATWAEGGRKCEIRFDRATEADVYVAGPGSSPLGTPLSAEEAPRLSQWLSLFVPARGSAQTLLNLGRLYDAGQRSKALDRLYALLDERLLEKRFGQVVELLDATPVGDLPVALLLGILTITKPWRGQLSGARDRVAGRVRARLRQEDPERCDELLRGLE